MAQHNEKPFEEEIALYLQSQGWLYSPNSAGYDKQRALFPEDVFAWLEDTQPAALHKVVNPADSAVAQAKGREQVLTRLAKAEPCRFYGVGSVMRR
jgi:type I restriction enzyme R subunit